MGMGVGQRLAKEHQLLALQAARAVPAALLITKGLGSVILPAFTRQGIQKISNGLGEIR